MIVRSVHARRHRFGPDSGCSLPLCLRERQLGHGDGSRWNVEWRHRRSGRLIERRQRGLHWRQRWDEHWWQRRSYGHDGMRAVTRMRAVLRVHRRREGSNLHAQARRRGIVSHGSDRNALRRHRNAVLLRTPSAFGVPLRGQGHLRREAGLRLPGHDDLPQRSDVHGDLGQGLGVPLLGSPSALRLAQKASGRSTVVRDEPGNGSAPWRRSISRSLQAKLAPCSSNMATPITPTLRSSPFLPA